MEKRTSSAITIIFYIIGIIFLVISAFMLVTAISYTKTYLQSYDASFADMWSHSLQYIIAQCGPYLGFGIVCLGIGKAIKEMRNAQASGSVSLGSAGVASVKTDNAKATNSASDSGLGEKVDFLVKEIEATREVIGIKIEEKEKRDSFRLKELGDKLAATGIASAEEVVPESVTVAETPIDYSAVEEPQAKEASAAYDEETVCETEPGSVPQITRQVEEMAMPSIPNIDSNETDKVTLFDKDSNENSEAEEPAKEVEMAEPGFVPEIMRQVGAMAIPEIPTVTEKVAVADESEETGKNIETISFDAFASRDTKRDTFSKSELKIALAREEAIRELEEVTKETKKKTKKKG